MAKEIQVISANGDTLYAVIFNSAGNVYSVSGDIFEAWNNANILQYAISMSEQGSSGIFMANFPTAPGVVAGLYSVIAKRQIGGSPAVADPGAGAGNIDWLGSKDFSLSIDIVSADISEIKNDSSAATNLLRDYDGTGYAKTASTIGPIDYKPGTVNDPSSTTAVFIGNNELSSIDDFYNGSVLAFTSGSLQGKAAKITDYAGSSRTFTFLSGFPAAPANGVSFIIIGIIP